jgi:F-type H+-transporting ATPase subunit delta
VLVNRQPERYVFKESVSVSSSDSSSAITGVAGRYASALFDLAQETGSIENVAADLELFEALVQDNPDLARLVKSPVFSSEQQVKAVAAVLKSAKIGGTASNFIRMVARNRRLFLILSMIHAFHALAAAARGEVVAEVQVAEPLSDKHLGVLKQTLDEVTGKKVRLNVKVDPSLIGGLIVRLGSKMIDSSVKSKLFSIKHAMKEVG